MESSIDRPGLVPGANPFYMIAVDDLNTEKGQQDLTARPPSELPISGLFLVPFSRDSKFVGREDIIAQLEEKRASAPDHPRIALVGLGGVGKSQIAIEYAYRIQETNPNTSIFWIHASTPARFEQGYKDIADHLQLPGRDDPKRGILQLVYSWLSDHKNGRWLMILDNVDDEETLMSSESDHSNKPLESYLPQTKNGEILVTSRNKVAALNLLDAQSIVSVDPMDEQDALALLRTRITFDEGVEPDAKALVQALECLPLAITHAAAYITIRAPLVTISSYLDQFLKSEVNQERLLTRGEWKDTRRDFSIRHPSMKTWYISFSQIQETQSSAADLLSLMSMFDKQSIPQYLLQGNSDPLDFEDAMALLLNFSLVRADVGDQSYSMHRLVQLSMRTWLISKQEQGKWLKAALSALNAVFPNGDYDTWAECQALLPHARKIMEEDVNDREDMLHQARVCADAGWYLAHRGDYKTAEKLVHRGKAVRERILGVDHELSLESGSNLAWVQGKQGKWRDAIENLQRALGLSKEALGKEHYWTLRLMSELSSQLTDHGKFKEAEIIQREALETNERTFGENAESTMYMKGVMGSIFTLQGKYNEAELMAQQTLQGSRMIRGNDHPYTIVAMANLARVYCFQERWEEAVHLYLQVVEYKKRTLGEAHPSTLNSIEHLARTYMEQGQHKEAEGIYSKLLETYHKVAGADNPATLSCIGSLAINYARQGRLAEAEELEMPKLERSKRTLGADHPHTLTTLNNLAIFLLKQGRKEEAIEMMKECVEGRQRVLGDEHPHYLSSVEKLTAWESG